MEFHPVILAAGRGSRMYPLTEECPKALLPVGNMPLVWYPVYLLEKNGYKKSTVVVSESSSQQIAEILSKLCVLSNMKISLEYVNVPENDDWETADALRHLKIKGDVLVLTCDLIANIPLYWLTDLHHTKNSTLTLLLVHPSHEEEDSAKKKQPDASEHDIIGLDDHSHLVYFAAAADLDESFPVRRSLLKRNPHIKFTSQLEDAHVYLMDRWVIEYLQLKAKNMSSVKGELIPHLVQLQNHKSTSTKIIHDASIINNQEPDEVVDKLEQMALEHSSFAGVDDGSRHYIGQQVQCNAVVVPCDGGICTRVNNLHQYITVNRMMYQHADQFGLKKMDPISTRGKGVNTDCLLGSAVQVSEKASVKRSCVGNYCIVGDKSKIIGSVLMDHVSVGEGCTIQNSVICKHVRIEDGANLKDCHIGANYTVIKDAELRGEILVAGGGLHI